MNFFIIRLSITGAAVLGLLTACSAGGTQFAPAHYNDAGATQTKVAANLDGSSDGSSTILFVSDGGNNTLARFTYPAGKYLGQVTGVSEPRGLCSDAKGNVWVTDAATSTLDKYSHTGRLLATLRDEGFEPYSCAVDPESGDLAVANIFSNSNGAGNLAIFKHASGQPAFYTGGDLNFVFYVAYAPSGGMVYIDGLNASEVFRYASFANGIFNGITIRGATVNFPGPLAWSNIGSTVDVADQQSTPPTIYRVSPSGRLKGSTMLQCSNQSGLCDLEAIVVEGPRVLVDTIGPGVEGFKYPQGGAPVTMIGAQQLSQPFGLAISPGISE
jgi:hypothetical protein